MKILIFLQGTAIMHKSGIDKTREERVKQSQQREESVLDYENYVPVGNAVEKLKNWQSQGGEIFYLSSHESQEDVDKDKIVLDRSGFPGGSIYWRQNGETYAEVVEKTLPDILIEDDCESIGGEKEMTYPNIKPELKNKIKSIVVKEFEGMDNLPSELEKLKKYG